MKKMLFYSTDTQRARVSPQGLSAEQDRHCLTFVESGITKVTSKLRGHKYHEGEEQVFRKYLMGETSPSRLPLGKRERH